MEIAQLQVGCFQRKKDTFREGYDRHCALVGALWS